MPIKLQSARQNRIDAYIDLVAADLATGTNQAAIEVPAGAVLIDGDLVTTEAFNSTATDVISVGDPGQPNAVPVVPPNYTRYLNAGSVHAIGRVPIVPTGYPYPAPTKITVSFVSGGGVISAGKATLRLSYYVRGRGQFAQGLDK